MIGKTLSVALLVAIATAVIVAPVAAHATTAHFNIPAGLMRDALNRFAKQTGRQVIFRERDVKGKRSKGVSGELPTLTALHTLLSSSGLVVSYQANGAIAIVPEKHKALRSRPGPKVDPEAAPPSSENEVGKATQIAEIVVTAQRRRQKLEDVPLSVAVVSSNTLRKENINTLVGLSNRTAGVLIRHASGGDQIAVRGVSSGFNPGFEQSVATFVDDVYRPTARSTYVGLFDVKRVEILKGPQTTYFGANAIGGAINIITRKPRHQFGANILAYYSPYNSEYKFDGGVDLPLGRNFAIRLAGRLYGMNAIAKDTLIGKRGELATQQFRISFLDAISNAITLEGRFDYARVRDTGTLSYETLDCPPHNVPAAGLCARTLNQLGAGKFDDQLNRRYQAGFLDINNLNFYEGEITANMDLGATKLITTTAYQNQTSRNIQDLVGFPIHSPLGVNALIPLDNGEHFKQFSQEIRLESLGRGLFSYMAGLYYQWSKTNVPMALGFFQAPLGALAPNYFKPTDLIIGGVNATQRSEAWSGFASLSYHFTAKLEATSGVRYSYVEKRATRDGYIGTVPPWSSNTYPNLTGTVTPAPIAGQEALAPILGVSLNQFPINKRIDQQWMPSANIKYKVTPDIMTYVSFAHGFKAGGYNLELGTDTFGPETVNAYEVGMKAAWFARHLITNFDLFRSDYNGLQVSGNIILPSGAFTPFIGNVANSRARGAELEVIARPLEGLSVSTSLSYVESTYLDYPNAPCSADQAALVAQGNANFTCPRKNLRGATLPNAPKWSGSVSADYFRVIGSGLKAGLGATIYFRSKYFLQTIPENLLSQNGYAKLDLRASVGDVDDSWDLSVIAENVMNKTTVSFGGPVPTAPGSVSLIADRGRSVGLQLRMNFGSSR